MKLLVILVLALGGCGACGSDHGAPTPDAGAPTPYTACAGDPASFVRQTMLALVGYRPRSQAEVDVLVDLYAAAQAKGLDPRETVARAIMARSEFAERWVDVAMDSLHVQRLDVQNEQPCWDTGLRGAADPALATAVRDQRASGAGDGHGPWRMIDLARSALALDDLSPIYRAQVFSLVYHPIPAANVPPIEAELARRADFGETFDSTYLHRNIVCLGCHNSEHSVTYSDDPAVNRHWPVPGFPEKAVYGTSMPTDPNVAHTAFRVDGFLDKGRAHPWGWAAECGEFATTVPDDPAGVAGKLASVVGTRTTVFDLEGALGRGFSALRGQLPPIGADGAIADPDAALAWLVTLKITEDVWKQATGTSLTIANYFPRNQAASDTLYALATRFTQSGFSLRALLVAIVETDYWNRQPPESGCGASPYTYPNVFDPWVISDPDPAKRKNGPGDAVTAADARTLVTATRAALGWPAPPAASRFPDYGDTGCEALPCSQMQGACSQFQQCCNAYQAACMMNGVLPSVELPFERGIGMFLRNSERGFRGLDFQARLVWENHAGACARPSWVTADFVDNLVAAGAADPTATAGDVIVALKDRLIGEPTVANGAEHDALVALIGGPLEAQASMLSAGVVRQICGALVGTPQFLMMGIAGRGGDRPKLTPPDAGYDAVCAALVVPGVTVTCAGGKLAVN